MIIKLLLISLFLGACASSTSVKKIDLKAPNNIRGLKIIKDLSFFPQTGNNCGPSSLAMMYSWAHKASPKQQDIASQVYSPVAKGSFPQDMLGAIRRNNLITVSISSYEDLFTELNSGNPVVILQNLGAKSFPIWHYSVVVGYDLYLKNFFIHTGNTAYESISFSEFDKTWRLAGYWGSLTLPIERTSKTAKLKDYLVAAQIFEQNKKFRLAQKTYYYTSKKWPQSPYPLIGLGNNDFKLGKYKASIKHYRSALRLAPNNEKLLKHNIKQAKNELKRKNSKLKR